jgi:hypothetical protein
MIKLYFAKGILVFIDLILYAIFFYWLVSLFLCKTKSWEILENKNQARMI